MEAIRAMFNTYSISYFSIPCVRGSSGDDVLGGGETAGRRPSWAGVGARSVQGVPLVPDKQLTWVKYVSRKFAT